MITFLALYAIHIKNNPTSSSLSQLVIDLTEVRLRLADLVWLSILSETQCMRRCKLTAISQTHHAKEYWLQHNIQQLIQTVIAGEDYQYREGLVFPLYIGACAGYYPSNPYHRVQMPFPSNQAQLLLFLQGILLILHEHPMDEVFSLSSNADQNK